MLLYCEAFLRDQLLEGSCKPTELGLAYMYNAFHSYSHFTIVVSGGICGLWCSAPSCEECDWTSVL